ncbi:MAG: dihydropteroate synthase [Solirubrobacteraceae bacterium]
MKLRARGFELALQRGEPLVMGIVNVGFDSVADSRQLTTLGQQLQAARTQLAEGAAIIDVGAQSGRTDTPSIDEDEEIALLTPLVSALAHEGVLVSVDTWRARVAEAAVAAGASIINDVGGLFEPGVANVAARSGAALVLMHTQAPPKVASFPGYDDPLADVRARLLELIDTARALGVGDEQLVLDPGLDYAKTPGESIAVLRRLAELTELGRPLLLAVSRKYFLGMLRARLPEERLGATLSAVGYGVDAGAGIVRVHDVAATVDYLAVASTLRDSDPPQLLGDAEAEELKWLPPKRAGASSPSES